MIRFLKGFGLFLLIGFSGLLMSFAHFFQYKNLIRPENTISMIVATFGLILYVGLVSSQRNSLFRFFLGFFGAWVFFSATIYWITYALHTYGSIPIGLSVAICLLLSGYCAVFAALWSLIAGSEFFLSMNPLRRCLALAFLWASLEAVRQTLFSGFPWGELGFAFAFQPWMAKTASIWGVHGLTFFWVFFALIVMQLDQIWSEGKLLRNTLVILLLFPAAALFSSYFPERFQRLHRLRIATIQPNVSQDMKWTPGAASTIFELLVDLTQKASLEHPDLIVWPETAYPFLVSANQKQMPFSSIIPVVAGALVREANINRNSALLIHKDQILQRFDKIHLVPFGEYVPLASVIPFGKLVANAGDLVPGARDQALLDLPYSNLKFGPLICYEDIFTDSSARHARRGANVLLNLTNDAWYGPTSALKQHADMASMQVYTTGIPMIRATNNGISSFITPRERISEPSFSRRINIQDIDVPAETPKTFFVWTHPLMEWIWVLFFVIALIWKEPQHQVSQRKQRIKRIFYPN